MALSEHAERLLETVEADDSAFTEALSALLEAAPQLRDAIGEVEAEASAWAVNYATAAFELGVRVATEPKAWLLA